MPYSPKKMIRRHVLISGRVTAVSFRRFVVTRAEQLGLNGWVKNSGENVEAVFEGPRDVVEKMIALSRKGPAGAIVGGVEVKDEPVRNEKGFRRL